MIDVNKPIEYKHSNYGWVDAKIVDTDYNGILLIKWKGNTSWYCISLTLDSPKLRNVPEKKTFTTITLKYNKNDVMVSFVSQHDREATVGQDGSFMGYSGYTVIGVHKGEYCV